MYHVTHNGGQDRQYTRLNDAAKRADQLATEEGVEAKVVHNETEAVVYVVSTRSLTIAAEGGHFDPWTRVEQPKHIAPDFDGYVPAYTRKRIQATVYRKNDYERGQVGSWRVFDGRSGKFRDVATTKQACELTTAMRAGLVL